MKRTVFGLWCADFAQILFKSHVITKYEKSRRFGIPFLFEKLSNRAPKKVMRNKNRGKAQHSLDLGPAKLKLR